MDIGLPRCYFVGWNISETGIKFLSLLKMVVSQLGQCPGNSDLAQSARCLAAHHLHPSDPFGHPSGGISPRLIQPLFSSYASRGVSLGPYTLRLPSRSIYRITQQFRLSEPSVLEGVACFLYRLFILLAHRVLFLINRPRMRGLSAHLRRGLVLTLS